MRRVLEALRSRFDRVILDMPPVMPLADVGVLAPQCRRRAARRARRRHAEAAHRGALAAFDRERLLGVVLNESGGVDPDYGYGYDAVYGRAAGAKRR